MRTPITISITHPISNIISDRNKSFINLRCRFTEIGILDRQLNLKNFIPTHILILE